jgi:hypothetical protein
LTFLQYGWAKTYMFFVAMGDYMCYSNGEPIHTI